MLSKLSPKKKFVPILRMIAAIFSIYGANDSFHRDKLPVCGCPAVITRISKGNERNLYDLTPLFAEDRTVFNWNDWFFSAAEFHPRVVSPPPVPSMSFDDLLKGAAAQLANPQA